MIGRKTKYRIVQKRGRDYVGHATHQADARAEEVVFDGGKAVGDVAPLRNRRRGVPLIVDVSKRPMQPGSEIVIDAK